MCLLVILSASGGMVLSANLLVMLMLSASGEMVLSANLLVKLSSDSGQAVLSANVLAKNKQLLCKVFCNNCLFVLFFGPQRFWGNL